MEHPQPIAPTIMRYNNDVQPSTSLRKESHSHQPSTRNNTMHSVVKGVSKLSLRTMGASAGSPNLDPGNFYCYEVGNDDGSHTTETATASTLSSLSPRSYGPIISHRGPSVRLPSPAEVASLSPPARHPQPTSTSGRHSTTNSTEIAMSAGIANDSKPCYDRRQSTGNHGYNSQNSSTSNKPLIKNPDILLENWSHYEWIQTQKKHRCEEDERQLELKKLWELQQQQQQQEQQSFHPHEKKRADEEERNVARMFQGPCDIDDVSVSSDDDDQDRISTRRSKGPCDVDETSMDSDSSENDSDDDDNDDKLYYKDDIRSLRQDDTDSYEEPPLEAQTSYARQQLLRSSRYREIREQTKAQRPHNTACYYQVDADFLDEVDMSRGLGGYEEGFDVPTINSSSGCHHLPLSIEEEENDEEASVSSFVSNEGDVRAWKNGSTGSTEFETTTAGDTLDSNSNNDQTRSMQMGWKAIACVRCRNGTCENRNCSTSGYMI
jgi:hypothetical protein